MGRQTNSSPEQNYPTAERPPEVHIDSARTMHGKAIVITKSPDLATYANYNKPRQFSLYGIVGRRVLKLARQPESSFRREVRLGRTVTIAAVTLATLGIAILPSLLESDNAGPTVCHFSTDTIPAVTVANQGEPELARMTEGVSDGTCMSSAEDLIEHRNPALGKFGITHPGDVVIGIPRRVVKIDNANSTTPIPQDSYQP